VCIPVSRVAWICVAFAPASGPGGACLVLGVGGAPLRGFVMPCLVVVHITALM